MTDLEMDPDVFLHSEVIRLEMVHMYLGTAFPAIQCMLFPPTCTTNVHSAYTLYYVQVPMFASAQYVIVRM